MNRLFLYLMVAAAMASAPLKCPESGIRSPDRRVMSSIRRTGSTRSWMSRSPGTKSPWSRATSRTRERGRSWMRTASYVTPGLIDIHAHVFWGHDEESQYSDGYSAVQPDSHSFRAGQTTLVDVGGAGWRSFPKFKEQVIDRSQTRVLSFLNIVGSGMRGGPVEQNLADMDAKLTAMRIRQHQGVIVGVKVAHYSGPEWDPVTARVAAGTRDERAGDGRLRRSHAAAVARGPAHEAPATRRHPDAHLCARGRPHSDRGRERESAAVCLGGAEAGRHLRRGTRRRQLLFRQAVPAMQQGFIPT